MTAISVLSRREALKLFGIGAGAFVIGGYSVFGKKDVQNASYRFNLFVSIANTGQIDIVCHRSEMGQSIRTSIGMLVADELDADFDNVHVVQGDGNEAYGDQNTDGSQSIRLQWLVLRRMGATARAMLVGAAAQFWNCKESECTTQNGFVIHQTTGHALSYGDLAHTASGLTIPDSVILKPSSDFKLIGKKALPVDVHNMTTGKALFGIDVEVPDMLIASIERSPAKGGRILSVSDANAFKVAGVKFVVKLDAQPQSINSKAGVAVIATNTWAALKGRDNLQIEWDLADASNDSDEDRNRDLKGALNTPGRVIRDSGNFSEIESVATHKSEFRTPFLAHAPMETPCATAKVTANTCEVWAATQDPQRLQATVATFLKIPESQVTVHVTMLGGGFGRKAQTDFAMEAVALSQITGTPIKVVFTREDDIKHSFYHSDSFQILEAGLDSDGMPVTWEHKTAFPTDMTVFDPKAFEPENWEFNMGASNLPYDIPNVRVKGFGVRSPVNIGWLRSVKNIFHGFAINTFLDELAQKAKIDPVEYRLRLLAKDRLLENDALEKESEVKQSTKRMAGLIQAVANQANWKNPSSHNEYRGFANHYSFFSYVAAAATLSVSKSGRVKVKRIDIGIDCGIVINPDAVQAQMEGAAIFGLTLALYGEINLDKGQVRQSNFHDYPLLRMSECPDIHVHITKSEEFPGGVGEPGVPPIAPAVANAIFQATGKRLRNLPLKV